MSAKLTHPLLRDGTSQSKRFQKSLGIDYVKLDERSREDMIQFATKFAHEIQFYNLSNLPEGTWETFIDKEDNSPHMALFIAFLDLLSHAQNQLNQITRRHLDFYFQDVLKLKRKPSHADKVHILLECVKHIKHYRLPKGSPLNAGEDDLGKDLIYQTDREIVITPAQIGALKSVFVESSDFRIGSLFASEVANSADGMGLSLPEENLNWSAFGESQKGKSGHLTMNEVALGFAIASPILLLKEGTRNITLNLHFTISIYEWLNEITDSKSDLELESFFSGDGHWHGPYNVKISTNKENGLTLKINLENTEPSVVPFNDDFEEDYSTSWPMIKIVCKKNTDQGHSRLMELELERIFLEVEVEGIKNMTLQNDQSVLFPDKPFLPFGATPTIGSAFYIGSGEVFSKNLEELVLNISWHEIPNSNMGAHYEAYSEGLNNTSFQAKMYSLHNKVWEEVIESYPLFNPKNATSEQRIPFAPEDELYQNRDIPAQGKYSINTQNGFLKLELVEPNNGLCSFGHRQYPNLYAKAIIEKTGDTVILPNAPYNPTIKSLTLDYKASQEISFKEKDEDSPEQHFNYFHIEPFGYSRIDQPNNSDCISFFPEYNNEGNFYIGLVDLVPPQNLSCLFQVAEGSGDPSKFVQESDIVWSYLSENGWRKFSSLGKLFDSTGGLLTSGIITFQIPNDASSTHSSMPVGYHWLKAEIKTNSAGVARMIDIKTQAVTATFVDQENDPMHLSKPLPPDTITELTDKPAEIKSIAQPFTSFGGKMEEQSVAFDTRVSERLRHKGRSVSIWDYEKLVLEKFPAIYQVRCINHTNRDSEFMPGAVTLVVVPNLRNINATNLLEPKVSTHVLNEIKNYITERTSPFVDIEVMSPEYEQLLLEFKVGFRSGFDAGFYGQKLNEELKRFLSPWAYDEGKDVVFGGRAFKSVVLTFVEKRPYVDFVNDFTMFHNISENFGIGDMRIGKNFGIRDASGIIREDLEVVEATSSRAILVSYPQHKIEVINLENAQCEGARGLGVGYMAVDIDFKVK